MSYIQHYYRELNNLRDIAGANNESALRQAFQFLLKTVGAEHKLILYPEYPFKNKQGSNLRADGALIDDLRMVHGYWEAKDEKDDLDKEIEIKLNKGYPSDNIIFEDTKTAVLLQNGEEILRCSVYDETALQKLLNEFFSYETPAIQNFKLAEAKFLEELPKVGVALNDLLIKARKENQKFLEQAQDFLKLCQRSIGERVTAHHVDEMLIQHILTDEIFRAIFPRSRFHEENHLAIAIHQLENSFFHGKTRQDLLKRLAPYFSAIQEQAITAIHSHEKQRFLKQIYEQFYSAYNPKDADKLGVVYTPNEAVQFMIGACDYLSQKYFKKKLQESGLDILDPCTGTGTFIVGLLDYWRGNYTHNELLKYKFENEIHANEISILPYYIACLNIEQSFYELTKEYSEFNGACFVNTLDNWGFEQKHSGANYEMFGGLTDENHARIQSQNQKLIPIIIGNPPYNANQKNENDNNKNDKAELVDKRIKETYLAESNAQKTKLYDPYIRFFRWASDRLGEQGMIAFITNRSYLDSRQADGFRKSIAKEFQVIYIIDLMSDVRKNPKISGTKHNIFGIQAGVAILFLVRNPKISNHSIYYLTLDDYLTAVEKRQWLHSNNLRQLIQQREFIEIKPNKNGAWLNQAKESDEWNRYLPLASKEAKAGKAGSDSIFKL
jgi:predicted helicase